MPLNEIGQLRYEKTKELQADLQQRYDNLKKELADCFGVDVNRIKLGRNPWTWRIEEVYLDGEPVGHSRLGWD